MFKCEMHALSPLAPLTSFPVQFLPEAEEANSPGRMKPTLELSSAARRLKRRSTLSFNQFQNLNLKQTDSSGQYFFNRNTIMNCCFSCAKILELYEIRYYSIGFQSGNTADTLSQLKYKTVTKWQKDDIKFLLNIYKYAKKTV